MIKLKELNLENFGEFSQLSVSFDDNVTYLVGPNGSGKSTAGIIGLQFVMQGIAEKSSGGNIPIIGERFRFIGENGKDAKGSIVLQLLMSHSSAFFAIENMMIQREFSERTSETESRILQKKALLCYTVEHLCEARHDIRR